VYPRSSPFYNLNLRNYNALQGTGALPYVSPRPSGNSHQVLSDFCELSGAAYLVLTTHTRQGSGGRITGWPSSPVMGRAGAFARSILCTVTGWPPAWSWSRRVSASCLLVNIPARWGRVIRHSLYSVGRGGIKEPLITLRILSCNTWRRGAGYPLRLNRPCKVCFKICIKFRFSGIFLCIRDSIRQSERVHQLRTPSYGRARNG
jgi:hypothetical protein